MKERLKIIIPPFNGITFDIEDELKKRGHIVDRDIGNGSWKKYDVIVTWNELFQTRSIVERARKAGKHTVLLQHGRRGTSRIYPPFNESLVSEKVCSWSENDKKRLLSCGVDESRIVVTGTPIFKHLKPRKKHDGINVVFSPEHWGEEVVENNIVASYLRRLDGMTVYTKVLQDAHYMPQYDNPIVSNRNLPEHLEIVADTLAVADVVVGISESTFELFAEYLDIPVVIADIWQPKACMGDDRYKDYHREYSNACTRVQDINKLCDAVRYAVKHPKNLQEERKQIAIDDGGVNLENPLENIIKVIENA